MELLCRALPVDLTRHIQVQHPPHAPIAGWHALCCACVLLISLMPASHHNGVFGHRE